VPIHYWKPYLLVMYGRFLADKCRGCGLDIAWFLSVCVIQMSPAKLIEMLFRINTGAIW